MRERAESIGGRLRVESTPGQGTRVIAEAPCAAPSPARPGLFG
jgi:signal transduction histidine kinase